MRSLGRGLIAIVAASIAGFAATNAGAATGDPLGVSLPDKLAGADFKQFCPVLGKAPKSLYLMERAIVASYQLPLALIDWNDTGVGMDEIHAAVSTVLCDLPRTAAQVAKCRTKENRSTPDANAQATAVNEIDDALARGLAKGAVFNLEFKDGDLHVEYRASGSAFNLRDRAAIKPGEEGASRPEAFFSSGGKYYTMTCIAKPKAVVPPPAPPPPGSPIPPSESDAKLSRDIVFSPIRLRGSTTDLAVSRDQDSDFKSASSATLSITNDNEAHTSKFDSHLAVGYALPQGSIAGADVLSIPYFKMDRSYTGGSGSSKTATNVDNIGVGLQENAIFPINGMYGNLAVQPDYTYSLRSEAKIGKLILTYDAFPPVPFYNKVSPIGWLGLSAFVDAQPQLNIGRVFSPGTDATLTDRTFTQAGAYIRATLSSDDADSPFNGFSIPLTYTYLYGFVGSYKAIQQFTAGVDYALTKYVSVKLSHTSGRNPDTFEKQSLYQMSLGLKY